MGGRKSITTPDCRSATTTAGNISSVNQVLSAYHKPVVVPGCQSRACPHLRQTLGPSPNQLQQIMCTSNATCVTRSAYGPAANEFSNARQITCSICIPNAPSNVGTSIGPNTLTHIRENALRKSKPSFDHAIPTALDLLQLYIKWPLDTAR